MPGAHLHETRISGEKSAFFSIALLLLFSGPLLCLGPAGCAGPGATSGRALLRSGDFESAATRLREDEARRPMDPGIKRDLGVALLEAGRAEAAWTKLAEARDLDPKDPRILFFLGRAAEALGRDDAALEAYGAYLGRARLNREERAIVRARIEAVTRESALAQIRRSLAMEESLHTARFPENTVAVPNFRNVVGSDTLAPLSRGLSAMVVTDLAKVRRLRVLERQRIAVLLDELKLGGAETLPSEARETPARRPESPVESTRGLKERLQLLTDPSGRPYFEGPLDETKDDAFLEAVKRFQRDHNLTADGDPGPRTQAAVEVALRGVPAGQAAGQEPRRGGSTGILDPATAPRAGQLLGARRLVSGSFAPAGGTDIRLDAALVSVPDGALTEAGAGRDGPLSEVLRLEKRLVYDILAALGIEPEPEEREEIDRLPTRSFLAFLAFSRGLDFEERGLGSAASAQYREAVRLDPGFEVARIRQEIQSVTAADQSALDRAELLRLRGRDEGPRDRLVRTAAANGLGPGVDSDRGDENDPGATPADRFGGSLLDAEIVIEGDVPESPGGRRP